MQTVKNSIKFEYPLDLVLQVSHFDMIHDLPGYTKMLDMEEIKLIRFDEHDDGSHDIEFSFKAKDKLPPFVHKIIKPEMLIWREVGTWNPETLTINLKVLPGFFPKLVNIRVRKRYLRESDCVTMEIATRISIGIPGIGKFLEKFIVNEINRDMGKMFGKIEQEIKKRAGSQSH